jgi:ribonuclease PH
LNQQHANYNTDEKGSGAAMMKIASKPRRTPKQKKQDEEDEAMMRQEYPNLKASTAIMEEKLQQQQEAVELARQQSQFIQSLIRQGILARNADGEIVPMVQPGGVLH